MPSNLAADAKVRARASEAFNNIGGGADKISKDMLADAMIASGFSNDPKFQCQALMTLDKNGDVFRDDFVAWCVARTSEGNGTKLNRLLIRYIVGKSRNTSYDLPGHDFTYGVPGASGVEPAGKIIFSMPVREKAKKKVEEGKNIIYENRRANMAGCINTKQANEWRDNYRAKKAAKMKKTREAFLATQADESLGLPTSKKDKEEPVKKPWAEGQCFGRVSLPSESVGALMVGLGVVEDKTYADLSGQTSAGKLPKPKSTKSADLMYKHSRRKPSGKVPFKLSKFKNVPAKTHNRR